MILEFFKTRKGVKTPERANPSDAGLDLFYCPEIIEESGKTKYASPLKAGTCMFDTKKGNIIINENENAVISTGIKVGVPHGYVLQVCNRGSMGAKKCLIYGAHIIDPGYDGEILIDLHNIGINKQIIEPGDKIAQLVLTPCIHFRLNELDKDELYRYDVAITNRGSGALASTGK